MSHHRQQQPSQRPGFPLQLDALKAPQGRMMPFAQRQRSPAVAHTPTGLGLDSATVRHRMVERLMQHEGICHPAVLHALRSVQRHSFVDSALVNQAYEDTSLPIGLGQTISKPSVVARMLELLLAAPVAAQREPSHVPVLRNVLEIGTGCGYQAALLSHVAASVVSVERLRGLHDKAVGNLSKLQPVPTNLHLIFGDGMLGHAQLGPYEGIISAAGGEHLPQAWVDQLAMGGRLVAPTASASGQQMLLVVDKTPAGLVRTVLEAVHFVPLKSGVA